MKARSVVEQMGRGRVVTSWRLGTSMDSRSCLPEYETSYSWLLFRMSGVDLGSFNGLATVAIVATVLSPVQARYFRTFSTTNVTQSCRSLGLNGRRRMRKGISC
jgi:hypothetical protein